MNAIEPIPERNAVPQSAKWNLEDMYPTLEAWEQDFQAVQALVKELAAFQGTLSDSPQQLLAYLQKSDTLTLLTDSLSNYANRKSDEDTRIGKYQDLVSRVTGLYVEIGSATAWDLPEIIHIPEETLLSFYETCPELRLYQRALTRMRAQKEHTLSDAEERILALSGELAQSPEAIFSMLNDADFRFPPAKDQNGQEHPVTHGSYIPLMQSQDRTLRKNAFTALYSVYDAYQNTAAAVLSAQVKALVFHARARRYPSTLEAALSATEVPTSVYHNLIAAVHENLPAMYRYVALRKKALGVEQLHMYDLYVPMVKNTTFHIPFEEAKRIVLEALAPMGEAYCNILKEGFANGWIDVYENVGKRSGAYSAGAKVHPYVLLNHKDTLDCMFTLAHEMGHAIHSYLSNSNQPTVYQDYVIFVAEVASTCNESLLMQHLLKITTDPAQKAYLINYFLEQFRGTVYRQTMFAEFELQINEMAQNGQSLTAETLCACYEALNRTYFGDEMVLDPEIRLEWARIPHFYYDYYVYQYATGFSAAIALSQRILREGEPAVQDYLQFLKGGCSADPISLLKGAGVDMATSKPITEALQLFDSLIDQLDELLHTTPAAKE